MRTVSDLLDRFEKETSPHRKGHRWEATRLDRWRREEPQLMATPLDGDIPAAVRAWRDRRLQKVSKATVNREMNLLAGVFTEAIKEWGLPFEVNPMSLVKRPSGRHARGVERTRLWGDELERLAGACAQAKPGTARSYLPDVVTLAIRTAMRMGELFSVQVKDVHLDEGWLRLHDTKNGDSRDVPLDSTARTIVARLLEGRSPEDRLLPVKHPAVYQQWRILRAELGLGDLRLHDARHTAATRLMDKFRDATFVSRITGHRSLQSLRRYNNPRAADLAKMLD